MSPVFRQSPRPSRRFSSVLGCLVLGLLSSVPLSAQVPNGNFETGDLTSWAVSGTGRVEVVEGTDLAPAITAPEGSFFALLSTGAGDAGGVAADLDSNGTADDDVARFSVTVTVTNAPEALGFEWSFLTSEEGEAALFDDFFQVLLDGVPVLGRSANKPGGVSPLQDTAAADGVALASTSGGVTNGSSFQDGRTPTMQFCLLLSENGTHTLEFLVADQGDATFDSGLIIDSVALPSAACSTLSLTQVTTSTGVPVEEKDGGLIVRPIQNQSVAGNSSGARLFFSSGADFLGDNPNGIEQIWHLRNDVYNRLTAATSGITKNPSSTNNGGWVAFESTADLTPGSPGNADGNREIYRCRRNNCLTSVVQVTDTTVCSNEKTAIAPNTGGRYVVFSSDCTDLAPTFNPDGNRELVIWDGNTGNLTVQETAGCLSRTPWIARHNAARYIYFVSSCDYTGGNGDGNEEIFLFDRQASTYSQVTTSALGAGHVNDAPTSNGGGRYLAFVSNADYAGSNASGNLVTYLWDRVLNTFTQLTPESPTALDLNASIDNSARFISVSRLNLIDSSFSVFLVERVNPGTLIPVVTGSSAQNDQPVAFFRSGAPYTVFQSDADPLATNADENLELFSGVASASLAADSIQCSAPGLLIPDNVPAGVGDTLTVSASGLIDDLDVALEIDHTWVGDLVVTLENVTTGTVVTLIDRPGFTGAGFGCGNNDIDATLDDDAALPAEGRCTTPVAISGSYTPIGVLSDFQGETLQGDWRLQVSDVRGGDTGSVVEWCLVGTVQ